LSGSKTKAPGSAGGYLLLEYEVHGKKVLTGNSYDNRFISVVTIEDRKIVHWRDYMDSLAAFTAETGNRGVSYA
jgi:limonene-1,2-epoxide hydrolase